jgi:PPOX class probable F420-dependent enzyme
MPRLSDEQAKLFSTDNYGVVATLRPDGSPQLTTVWVDYDGEDVLFNTAAARKKVRNLEHDPRATVHVYDGNDRYRWVSVSGPVQLTTEGAEEHANKLSQKYRGRDFSFRPGEQRVIARVKPERVTSYGLEP